MLPGERDLFYGDLKIPECLGPMLNDLVSEILRHGYQKEEDIKMFCSKYFDSEQGIDEKIDETKSAN